MRRRPHRIRHGGRRTAVPRGWLLSLLVGLLAVHGLCAGAASAAASESHDHPTMSAEATGTAVHPCVSPGGDPRPQAHLQCAGLATSAPTPGVPDDVDHPGSWADVPARLAPPGVAGAVPADGPGPPDLCLLSIWRV